MTIKYSITIDKLVDENLKKYIKTNNFNAYTSTIINGKENKKWDAFTLVILGYLVSFRKLRKE